MERTAIENHVADMICSVGTPSTTHDDRFDADMVALIGHDGDKAESSLQPVLVIQRVLQAIAPHVIPDTIQAKIRRTVKGGFYGLLASATRSAKADQKGKPPYVVTWAVLDAWCRTERPPSIGVALRESALFERLKSIVSALELVQQEHALIAIRWRSVTLSMGERAKDGKNHVKGKKCVEGIRLPYALQILRVAVAQHHLALSPALAVLCPKGDCASGCAADIVVDRTVDGCADQRVVEVPLPLEQQAPPQAAPPAATVLVWPVIESRSFAELFKHSREERERERALAAVYQQKEQWIRDEVASAKTTYMTALRIECKQASNIRQCYDLIGTYEAELEYYREDIELQANDNFAQRICEAERESKRSCSQNWESFLRSECRFSVPGKLIAGLTPKALPKSLLRACLSILRRRASTFDLEHVKRDIKNHRKRVDALLPEEKSAGEQESLADLVARRLWLLTLREPRASSNCLETVVLLPAALADLRAFLPLVDNLQPEQCYSAQVASLFWPIWHKSCREPGSEPAEKARAERRTSLPLRPDTPCTAQPPAPPAFPQAGASTADVGAAAAAVPALSDDPRWSAHLASIFKQHAVNAALEAQFAEALVLRGPAGSGESSENEADEDGFGSVCESEPTNQTNKRGKSNGHSSHRGESA